MSSQRTSINLGCKTNYRLYLHLYFLISLKISVFILSFRLMVNCWIVGKDNLGMCRCTRYDKYIFESSRQKINGLSMLPDWLTGWIYWAWKNLKWKTYLLAVPEYLWFPSLLACPEGRFSKQQWCQVILILSWMVVKFFRVQKSNVLTFGPTGPLLPGGPCRPWEDNVSIQT